ncbi:MAG: M15 family metallopeptidase [Verrucomicrobiota bacterium]
MKFNTDNVSLSDCLALSKILISKVEEGLTVPEKLMVDSVVARPVKVDYTKSRKALIELPEEAVPGSVVDFYGSPKRDPGYLAWFDFPTDKMRLYARDGSNLTDHNDDGFDDHRCHRLVVSQLESAFAELWEVLGESRFFSEGWHVYSGCFNYRRKKAGSGHSVHSWGAAIDLTAWGSGLITRECGFSLEGVSIMESHGFLWGPRAWGMPGEFENRKYPGKYFDAMHFQAAVPYLNSNSYYAKRGLPENIRRWQP